MKQKKSEAKKQAVPKTSPQLRPVLIRLKRLIEISQPLDPAAIVKVLDLTPRKPTDRFKDVTMWRDVKIANITGTFDVVLHSSSQPLLHLFPVNRIKATEVKVSNLLHSIFGSADIEYSNSKKGYWVSYPFARNPRWKLSITFDSPTKQDTSTRFSGASVDLHTPTSPKSL
jgi:hypothetical protein